jgi:hypothetical protein
MTEIQCLGAGGRLPLETIPAGAKNRAEEVRNCHERRHRVARVDRLF